MLTLVARALHGIVPHDPADIKRLMEQRLVFTHVCVGFLAIRSVNPVDDERDACRHGADSVEKRAQGRFVASTTPAMSLKWIIVICMYQEPLFSPRDLGGGLHAAAITK